MERSASPASSRAPRWRSTQIEATGSASTTLDAMMVPGWPVASSGTLERELKGRAEDAELALTTEIDMEQP